MYLSNGYLLKTLFILLFIPNTVVSKCSENICENVHDVFDQKLDKTWNFVHFQHWYPVKLVTLEANTFKKYEKLEYITFKKLLNGIQENSLNGLSNLHTIVFVDNILRTLPQNLFKGCSVEKIVIRSCKLQEVSKNVFNLDSLTHLKIENNDISEIQNNVFPKNLIELSLKNNGIAYIEENAFKGLRKLQVLELSNNYLTTFDFKIYLSTNINLRNIQLSFNYLQNVPVLPTLNKLKYLYLDNNTIHTIEDNFLDQTPNLEILNLSSNYIYNLTAFKNKLTLLNKLYLSHNNLTCIQENFLALFPNLRTIWVGANPLVCNCYINMQKYLVKNNILHPYNFESEWNGYNDCIRHLS